MLVDYSHRDIPVNVYDYLIQLGWARDLVLGFLGSHLQGDLPLISVRDLCVSYGSSQVLENASIDLVPGEVLAIVGLSGSGKSGIVQALAGMSVPKKGKIRLKTGVSAYTEVSAQKGLAMIGVSLQDPSVYPELTVKENMVHFARLYGLDKKNALINARHTSDAVGIRDIYDHKVRDLNEGQKKMVDLAVALVHGPQILILDSPFQGLDPLQKDMISRLINSINQKGVSVIITASDFHDIQSVATRVVIIKDKKIVSGQRVDPLAYTIAVSTRDKSYGGLSDYLTYLGADRVLVSDGRLTCQTNNPEVFLSEVTKHLLDNNKHITGMWCEKGARWS